jgi:hypothetical protein
VQETCKEKAAESELGSESPLLCLPSLSLCASWPPEAVVARILFFRPTKRGERGDVYSTVYRRAARSETEVRTSKQQCPNHVTAFYGSGPTTFYACPSCLSCLSLGRLPVTPCRSPYGLCTATACSNTTIYILQELTALRKGTPTLLALACFGSKLEVVTNESSPE